VVVEHDDVEAEARRLRKRLVARGAAIDRDQQRRALRGEVGDGGGVRAVALGDAVRDVDQERRPAPRR
jgi:hypothetical protein